MTLKKIIVRSLSSAHFSRHIKNDDIRLSLYDISGQVDNGEKPSLQVKFNINIVVCNNMQLYVIF
jgi:hypothetical protein